MTRPEDGGSSPDLGLAPARWWVGLVYVGLFAVSVPWYLPVRDPVPLWLGLPYWVVVSLLGSLAIALFTAFVVVRFWPEEPADSSRPDLD